MRLPLIAGIVVVTGLTFFAATQSIDAMSSDQDEMRATSEALKAELAAKEERYLEKVSAFEAADKDHADAQAKLQSDLAQAREGLATAQSELAAVAQAKAKLTARLDALDGTASEKEAAFAQAQDRISALVGTVEAGKAELQTLDAQLSEMKANADAAAARIAALEKEALEAAQAGPDPLIAELQAQVAEKEAAMKASEDEIAALLGKMEQQVDMTKTATARVTTMEATVAGLTAELGQLTSALAQREAEITAFQASVAAPEEMTVAQCTQKTDRLLSKEQIVFKAGTHDIDESSFGVLEQLSDIAQACAQNDMFVTIGGHTDSQGGESFNQQYSEKRSVEVRNFLENRGVPTASMQAVGYGESRPIADNDTAVGRVANRRITFEWQLR